MIKIDKHNVEAYYLDYLEGNLNAEDTAQLLAFIDANPAMAELFADTDDILALELQPSNEQFGDLDDLKTFPCGDDEICAANIDYWLIAKAENTLTEAEVQAVNAFVATHDLGKTEAAVKSAYFKPNLNETFGSVAVLKKEGGTIIPLLLRMSNVAAIFIFIWLIWPSNSNKTRQYSARDYSATNADKIIIKDIDTTLKDVISPITVQESLAGNTVEPNEVSLKKNASSSTKKKQPKKINLMTQKFANITANPKPALSNPPSVITEDFDLDVLFADLIADETAAPNIDPENPQIVVKDDDVAMANTNLSPTYQLKEQYRPVTKVLSNLTSLDMSYKKAPESAQVNQTVIQIGGFSFERKRKK